MNHITLRQICILVSVCAAFFAGWCGHQRFSRQHLPASVFYSDITLEHFQEIERRVSAKNPKWEFDINDAPITSQQILQTAKSFRDKSLQGKKEWLWRVKSISLLPMETHYVDDETGNWCWNIKYKSWPTHYDPNGHLPQMSIYVMMDGSIFVPIEYDDPIYHDAGYIPDTKSGT